MSDLPTTMTAIAISEPGGPDVLKQQERPVPEPAAEEVLIKIAFAGVNRPDCLQRTGAYPAPPGASDLPGLEAAGTIVAIGEGVADHQIGDPVTALLAGGGYAPYATAHAGHALPIPSGLDLVQAAALPETFFTVWHNVFQRGGLKSGERFLVHGGSSGIGTTAIQLAKAFGAEVFTTAGSDEKCDACHKLGADHVINYRNESFVDVIKDKTNRQGVNVILDMVGGDYISQNHSAAAVDGRIVQIAFLQGSKAEMDFTRLMIKRLVHTGSTLRPRDNEFKSQVAREIKEHVWPLIEAGKVVPVMDQMFDLSEANLAHRRMEEGNHIGKIMLRV
ncbi:MAG: NAD(P)H-quinone oxidoreductase [Pseudomonadota bacterium]